MLAAAQVAQTLFLLPDVPNHRFIMFFVNVALVIAIVQAHDSKRFNRLRGSLSETVFRSFVPFARFAVIAVYGFAALAKLNYDYFNPGHSCCTKFYGNILDWNRLLPRAEAIGSLMILATVVIELSLPILLMWSRSRVLGVVVGLAFHLALSLDLVKLFLNFSATMSALLILFLPGDFYCVFIEKWRALRNGTSDLRVVSRLCAATLILHVPLVITCIFVTEDKQISQVYISALGIIWWSYSLSLLIATFAYLRMVRNGEFRHNSTPTIPFRAPLVIVAPLVIINGCSPYLGIKTRTSFNMYSNLRIEADYSNHLFMPESADLLGNLSDTVSIVETDDPQLKEFEKSTVKLTYFEFSSHVANRRDLNVVYRRGEELLTYRGRRLNNGVYAPHWILRKLLLYRPVGDGVEEGCIW
ncbi:MAG: HTTM domain-containing protein [Verrucomicrobiales bacterium]